MSLDTYLGRRGNILAEGEEHAALVHVPSPVLLDDEMGALMRPEFGARVLPITFDAQAARRPSSALEELRQGAVQAVDSARPCSS